MTGLITSTIRPSSTAIHSGPRSAFAPSERLAQTAETVRSLLECGVTEMYVLDNSAELDLADVTAALAPARVVRCPPTEFANKGISEAHMVLYFCRSHALSGPLLKVSGRYTVGHVPAVDWSRFDIMAQAGSVNISTQCYTVRNSETMERLMTGALRAMYGYMARVVGLRSAWRIVRNSLFPNSDTYPYHDTRLSLEFGCRQAIRHERLRLHAVESFGVNGANGGGEPPHPSAAQAAL